MSQRYTIPNAPVNSQKKDGITVHACGESSALSAAQGSLMRQEHAGDTAQNAEQR